MLAFAHDLRFGLRSLIKNPGFTFVAVLSLGLGIGAVTSVYSMISAVLITPLPYEEANRIVSIRPTSHQRGFIGDSVSYPEYREWQKQNTCLEYVAAYSGASYNLTGVDEPLRVGASKISHTFFPLLRIPITLGRNFTEVEDRPGAPKAVILTYKFWKSHFNSRADVIGESISLDGEPFEIVGVTPEKFLFLDTLGAEIYLPIGANSKLVDEMGASWLNSMARLKPGVSLDQAQAEMTAIADRLSQQFPNYYGDRGVVLLEGSKEVSEDIGPRFAILFGVVTFVLLIACVNVANLLLSKAAARQKEISVRAALGASRVRIVRQLLTESLLLAVFGGALGLLVTMWGMDIITALLPAENAKAYVDYFQFGMNPDVFMFSAAASIATGLIFGLVPAWQASRPNLNETLKEGGVGAGLSRSRHRILNSLVVLEVALALVLVIGATLMVQSFSRLQEANPGFTISNLLTLDLELTVKNYPSNESKVAFFHSLEERLRQVPGVEGVGGTTCLPFSGSENTTSVSIEGLPDLPPGKFRGSAFRVVTPDYLETLGAGIVEGRPLTWADSNPDAPVALVNEAFVKMYYPGESGLNKRFKQGARWENPKSKPVTIVGVVADFTHRNLREKPGPELYLPFAQRAEDGLALCLRSKSSPDGLAAVVRQSVHELDPNQPLSNIRTMEEMVQMEIWMDRFTTILFAIFAGVALFLATIGVYGVINYSVLQQTHEIGVRLALGAHPRSVLIWVVRKGITLAIIGLGLGVPAAIALTSKLREQLYGISPFDPITFVVASLFLVAIAGLASLMPARRATAVDPVIALRYE